MLKVTITKMHAADYAYQMARQLPHPSHPAPVINNISSQVTMASVETLIADVALIANKIKSTPGAGQFPMMRHVLYELLKSQGDTGAIINELVCAVCQNMYNTTTREPCVSSCGHTTCRECSSRLNACATCRCPNFGTAVNFTLRDIVSKLV